MKKPVMISIEGRQTLDNMQEDKTELLTEGTLYKKGTSYFLVYEESEMTGLPGTKTTVRLGDGLVSVTRTGRFPSTMQFELGKQHLSLYNTPFGALTTTVSTDEIAVSMNDSGGDIRVGYSLQLDHNHVGKNLLKIKVIPTGSGNFMPGDLEFFGDTQIKI